MLDDCHDNVKALQRKGQPNSGTSYLLLHLGAGLSPDPPSESLLKTLADVENAIGIKIRCHAVGSPEQLRFFYSKADPDWNDIAAAGIAECFLLMAQTLEGPLFEMRGSPLIFPCQIQFGGKIDLETLTTSIHGLVENFRHAKIRDDIVNCVSIVEESVTFAWEATPALLAHVWLRNAAAFLVLSQSEFYVSPGQLVGALGNGDFSPPLTLDLARWESSYQNSYKAIEAILGDPPKDEARFRQKLVSLGINPEEEAGFEERVPIQKIIRAINKTRDSRVAHGSTSRGLKLREMVEMQECATAIFEYALRVAMRSQNGTRSE